jgi:hypothetical protein
MILTELLILDSVLLLGLMALTNKHRALGSSTGLNSRAISCFNMIQVVLIDEALTVFGRDDRTVVSVGIVLFAWLSTHQKLPVRQLLARVPARKTPSTSTYLVERVAFRQSRFLSDFETKAMDRSEYMLLLT